MALVKCKECGKKVSSKAEVCIGCGHPIKTKKSLAIEFTNKSLKFQRLVSGLMIIIGFSLAIYLSKTKGSDTSVEITLWVFAIGLLWHIVTRVRIWWNHD